MHGKVVGVGKEGRECHFTIKDISPGVVVLSTSTGTLGTGGWLHLWQRALTHRALGCERERCLRPADKVQGHAPAHFAVDAVLGPVRCSAACKQLPH